MNVARWIAAGIGVGACGGFVVGLLRPRSLQIDALWLADNDHELARGGRRAR